MFSPTATKLLAVGVLAAMGLLALGYAAMLLRRSPFTAVQSLLYGLNYLFARIRWGARIEGRLSLPEGQGAVIVCNHRSSIDPSFITASTRRVVHWMVAKEYWRHPMLGWLFRQSEAIPVSRAGIDTAATKSAIRLAAQGGVIGMFPEGRINTTERLLLPGRPGAALVALKAGVPVVPCYVEGSPYDGTYWGCLFMTARVRLRIGRPIDLAPFSKRRHQREVLEAVTKRLLAEIAILAGVGDYSAELAGRFYKPGLTPE